MLHHLHKPIGLSCFVWLTLAALEASAVTTYEEAVDGDLSGDRLNPTQIMVQEGVNSLLATTGPIVDDDNPYDQEYLRIDLPAGFQLSQIVLQEFDSPFDDTAFIGVQSGTTFSFDPQDAFSNIGNLLGWSHFGPGSGQNIGDDILADIGAGNGAIGFVPPLPGPSYTFWLQQTGSETTYQLDFVVTPIPEPATSLMVLEMAGLMFGLSRRRNRLVQP